MAREVAAIASFRDYCTSLGSHESRYVWNRSPKRFKSSPHESRLKNERFHTCPDLWYGHVLRWVMSEVTTDVEIEHTTVKTFPNLFEQYSQHYFWLLLMFYVKSQSVRWFKMWYLNAHTLSLLHIITLFVLVWLVHIICEHYHQCLVVLHFEK